MFGFWSAAVAQEVEHLARAPLEEPDVDEVDAQRRDRFRVLGRRLVREGLEGERLRLVEIAVDDREQRAPARGGP